jgi:uncharacterized small protein (DUF1192 family)
MITKALVNLRPNAQWRQTGFSYDGLEWLDSEQTKPTEAELTAEIERLQAEHDANEYQRKRAAAYPSFADQFDLLYHGGYDAWKAAIEAVKQEYPK